MSWHVHRRWEPRAFGLLCLAFILTAAPLRDQEARAQSVTADAGPAPVSTRHAVMIAGQSIPFTATAGATIVRDPATDVPLASVFSVAYLREGQSARRPVAFAYNGGPGTSAAFLHLGTLGPRRVEFPTDLSAEVQPPFATIPNDDSPLDVTDIVMIDPPETGYSRTLPGDTASIFTSIFGDARIVASFIRTWLKNNGRESSPVFIIGESYGATRTTLVARDLLTGADGKVAPVRIKGLALVSQMLVNDELGRDGVAAAALPTLAAVAWYHGKVNRAGRTFDQFLQEVQRFAVREYLPALALGRAIEPAERSRVAAKLASVTGLRTETILRNGLRVPSATFRRELIPGKILGSYDGRYSGVEANPENRLAADPSQRQIEPIIEGAIAQYLRNSLRVSADGPYLVSNRRLNGLWDFGPKRRPSALTFLSDAISKEPGVFVLVAHGYHDITTPYGTGVYLVSSLATLPGRAELHGYTGGHMFYSDPESRRRFAADLRRFITRAAEEN